VGVAATPGAFWAGDGVSNAVDPTELAHRPEILALFEQIVIARAAVVAARRRPGADRADGIVAINEASEAYERAQFRLRSALDHALGLYA
jgi:hypothetical protein